jgi:hypothetical protein
MYEVMLWLILNHEYDLVMLQFNDFRVTKRSISRIILKFKSIKKTIRLKLINILNY